MLPRAVQAASRCGFEYGVGQVCHAYVTRTIHVHKQETPVTCWAASIVNLLRFFGLNMDERTIVKLTTKEVRTARGDDVSKALNKTYQDSDGNAVAVSSIATDNWGGDSRNVDNQMIYDSIAKETPVFYGDWNHAMLLVRADFLITPGGRQPIGGGVIDPASGIYRNLAADEMHAFYAAVVSVTKAPAESSDASSAPVRTDGSPPVTLADPQTQVHASAPPIDTSEFCIALRSVISKSPKFESLRSKSKPNGDWDGIAKMPGLSTRCTIPDAHKNYVCIADDRISLPTLIDKVSRCLSEWQMDNHVADNVHFTAPGSHTDVRVFMSITNGTTLYLSVGDTEGWK